MNKTMYAYVPGLGGEAILQRQRNTVASWQSDQRDSVFIESNWNDSNEDYQTKLARMVSDIRQRCPVEQPLCIVGTSAGGTLGLNIYNEIKDDYSAGSVSVGGKIIGSDAIGPSYSQPFPALRPAVERSEQIIEQLSDAEKDRILSIKPLFDQVVLTRYMHVKGAHHRRSWTVGHIFSIFRVLKYRQNWIFKFVNKKLNA